MMEYLFNIIEGLNRDYELNKNKTNGHFILFKEITNNPVIKALKIYKAQVIFVTKTYKQDVFGITLTTKPLTKLEEDKFMLEFITQFITNLLKYVQSEDYKKLINGI